jgi:hypothetical protein
MSNDQLAQQRAKGIVRNVLDDAVEVLLEFPTTHERRLLEIPVDCWQIKGIVPTPDQSVDVTWDPDRPEVDFEIQVSSTPFERKPPPSWLQEFYGLGPSSRVVVIVSPTTLRAVSDAAGRSDESAIAPTRWSGLLLKTAGWGECLCLSRIPHLLDWLGVPPDKVEYKVCDPHRKYDPERYAEHSIFFLGSIKSNGVLREHYWDRLDKKNSYRYGEEYDLKILEAHAKRPLSEVRAAETNHLGFEKSPRGRSLEGPLDSRGQSEVSFKTEENLSDVSREEPQDVEVNDYFLLMKKPNPLSKGGGAHNCFVLSGTGTIGTGYAGVTLVAFRAVKTLHHWFGRGDFEIVGRVQMSGMFNPKSDPVTCVYDGNKGLDPEVLLLPNGLSSPAVWHPDVYTDSDFAKDMKRFKESLRNGGERP